MLRNACLLNAGCCCLQELDPTTIDNLVQHQGDKVRQQSLQLALLCAISSGIATYQTQPDRMPLPVQYKALPRSLVEHLIKGTAGGVANARCQ